MTSVMWFRRDLRLKDNIALLNAIKKGNKVFCVFHINPEQLTKPDTVNQSAFFASVKYFKDELKAQDIQLNILYGDLQESFQYLKDKVPDWQDIFFNFDEKGFGRQRDQKMVTFFENTLHIKAHPFVDYNLHGATEIKKDSGEGYKVFTPYFKKWINQVKPVPKVYDYTLLQKSKSPLFSENDFRLSKLVQNQRKFITNHLGTKNAEKALHYFITNNLAQYDQNRDIPALDKTSHLSRYLRTGEISIRTIWQAVVQAPDSNGKSSFIKELCWRDFYNMIYVMYPNQQQVSIKQEFEQVDWINDQEQFELWKSGQTGFPIVDAGMRQLNKQGWMHNRLRMIVASFLTKDLLIDWRWGEAYFHEKLLDYDAASNIGGWQWAASTGTDSVPYFRIFNPKIQSQKFDPDGLFIKQYVPELKNIDTKMIHEPNKLSVADQKKFGVTLGRMYPLPIVDHAQARKRAISFYEASKDV
ncbi:cryptochrome/photolyase family protein [Leuconostoc litchii]|uniref:Deoxyribodipyrimidine photo-lyase n=1 Tax=Leuconostoc litchii TaxID=1981069 RepID=A0A6P2CNI8_9LACO|nr:deoxyribodipyrimidine photo-lyase [Leuconostoc litchii]TYC47134.1 deoxyribodipyrimidine photo-lyase [Leuconostoc litchii]